MKTLRQHHVIILRHCMPVKKLCPSVAKITCFICVVLHLSFDLCMLVMTTTHQLATPTHQLVTSPPPHLLKGLTQHPGTSHPYLVITPPPTWTPTSPTWLPLIPTWPPLTPTWSPQSPHFTFPLPQNNWLQMLPIRSETILNVS